MGWNVAQNGDAWSDKMNPLVGKNQATYAKRGKHSNYLMKTEK